MKQEWFTRAVSALAYSFCAQHADRGRPELAPPFNDVARFVLGMHGSMTDFLRLPTLAATLGFDALGVLHGGARFHKLPPDTRRRIINTWKSSPLAGCRDLMRLYESLSTLALFNRLEEPQIQHQEAVATPLPSGIRPEPGKDLSCEVAVIGSGPGGAIVACLLAEAGRDVLLIEEGPYLGLNSCRPFSMQEMRQKYRNGGLTMAMGKTQIAYVEGRCVGGGSEINSGLYHRTPPDILETWRREFEVEGITETEMRPHFEACERDVSVSHLPAPAPSASAKLHEGAARLGWHSLEVPRWFRYDTTKDGQTQGKRQSMTETFVPRFLRAGGRLLPLTRATRLRQQGGGWVVQSAHQNSGPFQIKAKAVFLCAGAIQTPALLLRSGITSNVGNALRMHPTVKVSARFPEPVTSLNMGVPVHQVKEFAPRCSLGCSISTPAFLALGMLDHPEPMSEIGHVWEQMANYYAMICSEGSGTVRIMPGFRDPLVRYRLTGNDHLALGDALRKLAEVLFAAGATQLYPSIEQGARLSSRDDIARLPHSLPARLTKLMTIHLFSSCPMGENTHKSAVNSFGKVHGVDNLFVSDASVLCGAPGVNPQGTVMALSRRNAMHYLQAA